MFGNFGNSSTFGGGAFSSPTSNASVFGQPQQQPAASTSLFGGGFTQPKPTFGAGFGTPQNQTSMFGQQNRLPVPSTGSIFSGPTATVSPFSATNQAQVAGTSIPFNAITGNDTMMKNGASSQISTRHQCITCMKEYENKSLEELRLEDYQLNRKGPSQSSLFGGAQQQQQQQQNTGLFSSIGASAAPTAFGQTNTFGGATTTGGGLFGNLNQPKPATSFFSNPATSTSAFGAPSSGFAFNSPTSQQASVFGSNNNPVSSAGGIGTTSSFSFGQPQAQQPQAGGLFSQKPLSAPTTSGFGAFGAPTLTNSTTANKPVGYGFGSAAPATFGSPATPGFGTGTGSLFGSQPAQQNKPFAFNTQFSNQALPTQSSFGSTGSSAFTFTTTTSAPALNFGSGSNTSFGGMGGGTTSSFGSTPLTFSAGGGQPNTGFGSMGFNTGSTPGFSNYTPPTNFNQSILQQQTVSSPPGAAFATTPYKDSALFYNLIPNRRLEDMIKPTSPAAQRAIKEASRRRTSASVSLISSSPNKNSTFPSAKNSPFNKQSIFDGFEDEDKGISIDILSPKTSVKKLSLKNFRNNSIPNHRHSISFSPASRLKIGLDNGLNDSISSEFDNTQSNDIGSSFTEKHQSSRNSISGANRSSEDLSSSNLDADNTHIQGGSGTKRFSDAVERSVLNGEKEKGGGCRVVNTRGGYYIHPSIEELDKLVDEAGNCFVKNLVIGRQSHGQIRFVDVVNIAGINLDEIVYFRHKEVVVYPDDSKKPPLGEGLNCPAEIRMERVWPIDKDTKDPIKSPTKLKSIGYEDTLRRSCSRLGANFISYDGETGVWAFLVKHFSKYSCEPEETEDVAKADAHTAASQKGLGGISLNQIQTTFTQKNVQESSRTQEARQINTSESYSNKVGDVLTFHPTYSRPRLSTHPIVTPLVQVSSAMEDSDLAYGDIEHNPMTPSESNDSELDWQLASGRSFSTEFDGILKDKHESETVRLMKSVMLMDVDENSGDIGDFQPPIKRSRQPLSRSSYRNEGQENCKSESLMSLKQAKSGSTGPSLLAIQESDEYRKMSTEVPPGYLPSISRRKEICYKPVQADVFERLASAQSNGCRIKSVPRVCFGPMGYFVTAVNSGANDKRMIEINRIGSYMNKVVPKLSSELYMEAINKQMKLELEDRQGGLVAKHIALLLSIIDSVPSRDYGRESQELRDELMMWELCEVLWPVEESDEMCGQDQGFLVKQRKELSAWFKKYCGDLFGDNVCMDKTILGLLKQGQKIEACELAVDLENYTLAMCLAQKIKAKAEEVNCGQQLNIWEEQEALNFIPNDMIRIYRLCCGETIFDKVELSNMSTSQWLQHFALYMWYSCPLHLPVEKVVMSFQSYLKSEAETTGNISFPADGESSIPNLCVQLLKLYSFSGYPMKNILNPRTGNPDCLEYKLSWLLMVNLAKFGYICDTELHGSITTSYAGQLEQIGLYQWAAFVMNHLPRNTVRDNFTQQILERNVGFWGSEEYETFLEDKLYIAPTIIFAAKSLRASVEQRKDRLIWFLLKAEDYQKAFNEFLKSLSVDSVISARNMESMLKILDYMDTVSNNLQGWDVLGRFLLDYLKLHVAKNLSVSTGRRLSDPQNLPVGVESVVVSFVKSFMQYKPNDESECAFLLELVLSAQKIVEVLMDSHAELIDSARKEERIADLISVPVPGEYMVELRYFLTHWLDKQKSERAIIKSDL